MINFASLDAYLVKPLTPVQCCNKFLLNFLPLVSHPWLDFRRSLGSDLVLPREERRIAVVSPESRFAQ